MGRSRTRKLERGLSQDREVSGVDGIAQPSRVLTRFGNLPKWSVLSILAITLTSIALCLSFRKDEQDSQNGVSVAVAMVNDDADAAMSPEALFEDVFLELFRSTKKLDLFITYIEEDFFKRLQSLNTQNTHLREIIDGIMNIIDDQREEEYKNKYVALKMGMVMHEKALKEGGFKKWEIASASDFEWHIDRVNQWQVVPPLMRYGLLNNRDSYGSHAFAAMEFASGTLKLGERFQVDTPMFDLMLLHELVHAYQLRRLFQICGNDELILFQDNCRLGGVVDEEMFGRNLFVVEFEMEAFSASTEIFDLMFEGQVRELCVGAEVLPDKTLNIQESDFETYKTLHVRASTSDILGLLVWCVKYFQLNPSHFPNISSAFTRDMIDTLDGDSVPVSINDLTGRTRDELRSAIEEGYRFDG